MDDARGGAFQQDTGGRQRGRHAWHQAKHGHTHTHILPKPSPTGELRRGENCGMLVFNFSRKEDDASVIYLLIHQ